VVSLLYFFLPSFPLSGASSSPLWLVFVFPWLFLSFHLSLFTPFSVLCLSIVMHPLVSNNLDHICYWLILIELQSTCKILLDCYSNIFTLYSSPAFANGYLMRYIHTRFCCIVSIWFLLIGLSLFNILMKLSAVCETKFHYQDKIPPLDYAVNVASSMQVIEAVFIYICTFFLFPSYM
jgi:hypothetical protein